MIFNKLTILAKRPQHAGTASTLKTADPTMVPTPKSPSVTKVPTQLMNNSGLELAVAMNVAPATSSFILRPKPMGISINFSILISPIFTRSEMYKMKLV